MAESLDVVARSPQEAHKYLQHAWEAIGKPLTLQSVPVHIRVGEAEQTRSLAANRYYWSVVLKDISSQTVVDNWKYTAETWHIHFKKEFLGYEMVPYQIVGKKRTYYKRKLRSTKDLTIKPFAEYLEKVIAYAVTDLGVEFRSDWFE